MPINLVRQSQTTTRIILYRTTHPGKALKGSLSGVNDPDTW